MANQNALTITQQYPVDQYTLLSPMQTVAEIADIQKPVMNVVTISTNLADGEIYMQEKPKDAYRDRPAQPAKYALTKKGLNKLMRAAGIKIIYTRPVLPAVCQKCTEVNRNIGQRVSCGNCSNKDVKYEARISVPQLTGENTELVAHKEIIVEDVVDGMTENQRKEFLKFRSEMCETKAINRAIRAALHIKGTYTLDELRKPFVVAYLVPNLDNEAVKEEAVKHFFAASHALYGSELQHHEQDNRVVYIDDDTPDDYITPALQEPPHEEAPAEPLPQQRAYRQPEPPQRPAEDSPDFDPTICYDCGTKCSNAVVKYSQANFGRTLCMNCQRKQGGSR